VTFALGLSGGDTVDIVELPDSLRRVAICYRAAQMQVLRWLYGRAAAIAVGAVVVVAGSEQRAAAQRVDVEAQASANIGFDQESRSAFNPDPNGQPQDTQGDTTRRVFMEVRPGLALRTGSPRVTWQAGYIFAGTLTLVGDSSPSYSNQLTGGMTAELTKFSILTLTAVFSQGGTGFQLSSRPADAGSPELRAPGNPDLITASAAETIATELGKQLAMQHTLVASINAPQDDLSQRNSSLAASLTLERTFERDGLGAELHAGVAWLRPIQLGLHVFKTYTSSALAHWNHDFSTGWNGMINAGAEEVFTDTGSRPLAFLPAGAVSLRYTPRPDVGAGIDFSHGTATNLQVGSVSLTDRLSAHGAIALDARKGRALAFSFGFLHNEPLGDVSALVSAGTGNAVQADVGYSMQLDKYLVGTARYSLAYQFGQGGGLPSTLAHILFVGVTGAIRNTEKPILPLPMRGRRVDGGDGDFPVVEEAPVEAAPRDKQ